MLRPVVCICLAFTLATGCDSAPALVESRAEVVSHRLFEVGLIRRQRGCTPFPKSGYWPEEFYEPIALELIVDKSGQVRSHNHVSVSQDCAREIQALVETWRYRPFEIDGGTEAVRIHEEIVVVPLERWRAPPRSFPSVTDYSDVVIQLYRSAGFYTLEGCPYREYWLSLGGSGSLVVEARQSGERREIVRANVREDDIVALIDAFQSAEFFSLEQEYHSGFTHQPGSILSIGIGEERGEVREALGEAAGMPAAARWLSEEVDRLLGTEQWVGPARCYRPHFTPG